MNEAEIILLMKVEASRNPAELLQPRKQTLDLPASLVTAQDSSILCRCFLSVRLVRSNHLYTCFSKLCVQWVGVISFVANQPFWSLSGKPLKESFSDKGDFMRRSRFRVGREWKTRRVCHCHELRAFTALGLTNSTPLFRDDER